MWDFFQTVRSRHSVRQYRDQAVEAEKLHAILETACSAPSAGDLQSYRIFVVSDADKKQALSNAADQQTFIAQAPIAMVFCTDSERAENQYGERGKTLFALQDTTIAAAYAQLAVVAAGMASTWVGAFDEDAVIRCLNLPAQLQPVAILSIGYPAEIPDPTARRHLEDVVTYL